MKWLKNWPRLTVLGGALGSGKTELAVNIAVLLQQAGQKVAVVDLDIVNPYFRTRFLTPKLQERKVEVIAPAGELALADVPALPPAITGLFQDEHRYGIFDLGGDATGSIVLGRFAEQFYRNGYHFLLVVNPYRPQTRDVSSICRMAEAVERAAALKLTGLLANPHLGRETDSATVLEGLRVVEEAAFALKLPLVLAAVRKDLSPKLSPELNGRGIPLLLLELYLNKRLI